MDDCKKCGKNITRDWGHYRNKAISLQKHFKRAEYWVVLNGKGIITLNDKEENVSVGSNYYIPVEAKHRLKNTGDDILMIAEIQLGAETEEVDIQRYNT